MENNLAKYLKLIKMTSEMSLIENRIDGNPYKALKIEFGDADYLENLYISTFEKLDNDKINYIEIINDEAIKN